MKATKWAQCGLGGPHREFEPRVGRMVEMRVTTPNQSVERTAAPPGRFERHGFHGAAGFGGGHGRAAVAHFGRSATSRL